MRIDELDPKHNKFKEVILDHELTEEQLDEILPAVAAVGGALARGAVAAGGALARGVGQAATAIGKGTANATRSVGRGIKNTAGVAKQMATDLAVDTAKKLSGQGTQGTQGTIGTDQSQGQQAKLQRGQELTIPQPDPKNPNKTIPTNMKIKNVSGREIELEPKKKQSGQPNVVKYNKKDLQLQ